MRPPRSTHSPPFMAGASIQKLQAQLAPAQSSQADQACCYTGGVRLRTATAEPTGLTHTPPGLWGKKIHFICSLSQIQKTPYVTEADSKMTLFYRMCVYLLIYNRLLKKPL